MFKREKVYSIKEFMSNKHREDDLKLQQKIKKATGVLVPIAAAVFTPTGVLARSMDQQIIHALDPLMNLVMDLSYPIAGVIIAGGCLFILCGFKEKGMDMIKNAAIGYILVQLSPLFLKILVQVGAKVF